MFVKSPLIAVKSDGTKVPYEIGSGFKLDVGTYYVDVGIPDADHVSVHVTWDATIVATSVNYQTSNLPAYKSESAPYTDSSGSADVSLVDSTAGNWLTEDPSSAYVPVTTGGTVTNMTLAIAGGTAGGAMFEIANANSRRARMKIVTTTGGFIRVHPHGKQA